LTDEADDAFLDATFEAAVFFGSFPEAARFASRAAFDAETILCIC